MTKKNLYLLLFLILSGMALSGFVLRPDTWFLIKKNFTLFSEVYESLTDSYIDEIEPDHLIRRGIEAMLLELDPYTVIIDESESQQMDILQRGQYAGVGLEIGARGGRLVVIAPIEGYSAERQGIKAGDIIKKVNETDVSGMSTEDLQTLLRGEPETAVTLGIKRFGLDELLFFDLNREIIEVKNISYYGILDGEERIGYIQLRRFAQNAAGEVREAIFSMEKEESLDGLILDVRNNPGGLLEEAVKIIDKFIPKGEKVVWTEGRLSRANQEYKTKEEAVFPDKPLVILQNNGSASASEILSGALQDLDRAVIIGQRSFGKGLVQILKPLSYNFSLKISTSKYFIPSGRSIQSTPFLAEEEIHLMEEVPDSLKERFYTQSGRKVYEGIGIEPDIEIDIPLQSKFEIALLQNSHYFFFANEYISETESRDDLPSPERIFDDFMKYLENIDFTYTTRTERHLNRFTDALEDNLKESAKEKIRALEEIIAQEKELDKKKFAEPVKEALHLELLSRFEGRSGRIREQVKNDEAVVEAIKIMQSPPIYFSILTP